MKNRGLIRNRSCALVTHPKKLTVGGPQSIWKKKKCLIPEGAGEETRAAPISPVSARKMITYSHFLKVLLVIFPLQRHQMP